MSTLTRRGLIGGSAGFAAAAAAAPPQSARSSNIVTAGVNLVEEDPNDDSVGYGRLPNDEGVVEFDASVMHGPTRRCGSVASIRNWVYPSRVAKIDRRPKEGTGTRPGRRRRGASGLR